MKTEVYIVTLFGCNSGENEMWPAESKIFTSEKEAFEYYLSMKPCEHTKEGRTIDGRFYSIQSGELEKRPDGIVLQKCTIDLP